MNCYLPYFIKSFKHDGHLHRMWKENWLIPPVMLSEQHKKDKMMVLINDQTPIQESNGSEWVSRIPGVSFFIPGCWFNVVALIEDSGVRYYCNIASPPYNDGSSITYIDYDLDVIVTSEGEIRIVDEEEYEQHKVRYHYSFIVEKKVKEGLDLVLERIRKQQAPFQDEQVLFYYEKWKAWHTRKV